MDPLLLLLVGIATVFGGILLLRLHPFLALVIGALVVGGLTGESGLRDYARAKKLQPEATEALVRQSVTGRVTGSFGATAGSIGLLIALASIIGKCLLDSGAADRIVRAFLAGLGEARAPLAFVCGGFLLGIPVFFDTVFFLMIPLAKSMRLRTGRNYALYIMAIIAGGTISHSLVPPTPGPLFVAKLLNVDMGEMIFAGLVIGSLASASGFAYAWWLNGRLDIPMRETEPGQLESLRSASARDHRELPPLGLSLLPIVLPIILITGQSFLSSPLGQKHFAGLPAALTQCFAVLGDPVLALGLSTVIAVGVLIRQRSGRLRETMDTLPPALQEAAMIILITSAGGAFGGILQQTGIGPRIEGLTGGASLAVLPLAWLVTALVRVAQGSATVAMITAVGIVAGLATREQLGFHPVYVAMAIGCGSKMCPWMNDSGFWVICKMSGFTEKETLQTFTPLLSVMGVAGLIVTLIMAKLFPMI